MVVVPVMVTVVGKGFWLLGVSEEEGNLRSLLGGRRLETENWILEIEIGNGWLILCGVLEYVW